MPFVPPTGQIKAIRIDDKWTVFVDTENNDRPVGIERYGEHVGGWEYDNFVTALLFAHIEQQETSV